MWNARRMYPRKKYVATTIGESSSTMETVTFTSTASITPSVPASSTMLRKSAMAKSEKRFRRRSTSASTRAMRRPGGFLSK